MDLRILERKYITKKTSFQSHCFYVFQVGQGLSNQQRLTEGN